jgi:hypothetical protein
VLDLLIILDSIRDHKIDFVNDFSLFSRLFAMMKDNHDAAYQKKMDDFIYRMKLSVNPSADPSISRANCVSQRFLLFSFCCSLFVVWFVCRLLSVNPSADSSISRANCVSQRFLLLPLFVVTTCRLLSVNPSADPSISRFKCVSKRVFSSDLLLYAYVNGRMHTNTLKYIHILQQFQFYKLNEKLDLAGRTGVERLAEYCVERLERVSGASAFVTFIRVLFVLLSCSLFYCSLGGASALVTFICVLFSGAP